MLSNIMNFVKLSLFNYFKYIATHIILNWYIVKLI